MHDLGNPMLREKSVEMSVGEAMTLRFEPKKEKNVFDNEGFVSTLCDKLELFVFHPFLGA